MPATGAGGICSLNSDAKLMLLFDLTMILLIFFINFVNNLAPDADGQPASALPKARLPSIRLHMIRELNVMKSNVLTRLKGSYAAISGILSLFALATAGCGSDNGGNASFPKNVARMSDAEKVAYVMKSCTPDSVARFICRAALGEVNGVKIDTLANATLYAYEHYKDGDLQTFSQTFDSFAEELPLDLKMRLRKLAAEQDPMGLGYQLGLEYVNVIRTDHKNAETVEREIAALKKECMKSAEDTATFTRFMKGFKVALDMDGDNDIPRAIYQKYSTH